MKLYRVHLRVDGGSSAGYVWRTSYREALKVARADYEEDPTQFSGDYDPGRSIQTVTVVLSKPGILAALQQFASYPDNG
jgi:predicted secreted protein